MTRIVPAITLCLSALCGTAFAQTIDTRPSTPGNPTARAYGPTSGGVAWQRSSDDRRVVGYEITRDGTVLGVRDTLSYVVDDLQPGRSYNIAIVAIDSAGQRSGRALARIETPDARPNRPTGLAATVYSPTAAGITWDRSGVFGERYEVKRDGEIVAAATNGTSYIDTTLSPTRPLYLYEVIAVNRQGQRSAASRLFVDTREGSGAPPPVAEGPAAPSGLRSVIYSSTAGAIVWDRSSNTALRYEVSRDGRVVSTTGGTSYVDDGLTPVQSYTYTVVAIARDGRRSAASTVRLDTSGGTPGTERPDPTDPPNAALVPLEEPRADASSVVDRLGSQRVLALARSWVDGSYFELQDQANQLAGYAGQLGGEEFGPLVVACSDGGTATLSREGLAVGSGSTVDSVAIAFADCIEGSLVVDGSMTRSRSESFSATSGSRDTTLMYRSLSVRDVEDEESLFLDGRYTESFIDSTDTLCGVGTLPLTRRSESYSRAVYQSSTEQTTFENFELSSNSGESVQSPECERFASSSLRVSARVRDEVRFPNRAARLDWNEESETDTQVSVTFDDGSSLGLESMPSEPGWTLTLTSEGAVRSYLVAYTLP